MVEILDKGKLGYQLRLTSAEGLQQVDSCTFLYPVLTLLSSTRHKNSTLKYPVGTMQKPECIQNQYEPSSVKY